MVVDETTGSPPCALWHHAARAFRSRARGIQRHAPTPTTSLAAAFGALRWRRSATFASAFAQRRDRCRRDADETLGSVSCLSGGGARGGAHIGVLKALEELRVPIDHDRGHEHRRRRRRVLCLRHERRGPRAARREPRVGDRVLERHAAAAQVVPPQARRRLVPRQSKARVSTTASSSCRSASCRAKSST